MNQNQRKASYEELIRDTRSYSCLLTTDGDDYMVEYDPGYDQWEPDGVIIWRLTCDGDWPSFAAVERFRVLVRNGLRGDELRDAIREAI